jgi:hypothetical protein
VPLGNDGRRIWRYGPCNTIGIDPKNTSIIFIGTDVGVFVSKDRGDTWNPFGTGLPVVVVDDIRITETGNLIYAATHGRGMWVASSILGINDHPPQPGDYTLEQNYPNPFSSSRSGYSSTDVSFQIPIASEISLRIFDSNGRLVRTLLNEMRDAGRHTIRFNASGMPASVYYYEFRAGKFRDVKKLILLR